MSALVQTAARVDVPVSEPEYTPTDADWDSVAAWDTHDHNVHTGVDSVAPRVNRRHVR